MAGDDNKPNQRGKKQSSNDLPSIAPMPDKTENETKPVTTQDVDVSLGLELVAQQLKNLPSPEILTAYARAYPGILEKITEWTERQGQHRQRLEVLRAEGIERRLNRGQLIAGSVALFGLGLASGVGVFGSATVASIIAVVSIGGPTAAIIIANYLPGSNSIVRRKSGSIVRPTSSRTADD